MEKPDLLIQISEILASTIDIRHQYLASVKETENWGSMLPIFYKECTWYEVSTCCQDQPEKHIWSSLQIEYQLLDGSTWLGDKYGSDRGNHTIITFEHGEELV